MSQPDNRPPPLARRASSLKRAVLAAAVSALMAALGVLFSGQDAAWPPRAWAAFFGGVGGVVGAGAAGAPSWREGLNRGAVLGCPAGAVLHPLVLLTVLLDAVPGPWRPDEMAPVLVVSVLLGAAFGVALGAVAGVVARMLPG